MPSPTPELIHTLVERLGSEEKALHWLGRLSTAILECQPLPKMPPPKKRR